jgi:hypothetical protein
MNRRIAALGVAMLTAIGATVALPHHSISVVEISTPVWVKGTVREFRAQHPHVMVKLEVRDKDGRPHLWDIEGPNLMRMERMHADRNFLKAGDGIEVCGFHLKQPWTRPDFIHGHVLVMPDGHMRHFGAYGKLANCIRPGDSAQQWARFLQQDALAMPAWCNSKLYLQSASVGPPALIAAIDRQLENPCR